MSRILVVEDEQHLAEGLRFNLAAEHHDVEVVDTGEAALAQLAANPTRFDLVILDVMLPGITGFGVAADLRRAGQFVPVLMLTARDSPADIVRGLDAGADDYLTKPFPLKVLLARLRALSRRAPRPAQEVLRVGDLVLNPATPLEDLKEILPYIDLVNVMTVEPGFGGQKFIPRSPEKISRLRAMVPEMEIEVDGGIDAKSARLVVSAGATVLVAGNSVFAHKQGIAAGIKAIRQAVV